MPDHPYQMLHERFIHGVEHIFQAAAQGDQTALALIHKRAKFLGVGAVALANIFSPECIIVAPNDLGDVDVSLLIKEIQDSICQRAFSVIADKVNVKLTKLGADIQLYGAMAIVLQEFFVNLSEERMMT
jgi:predicted NBD/HSP70 family sugar kinase